VAPHAIPRHPCARRPRGTPRKGEASLKIKSPIGFPASSSACGFRIGSARAAGWTPAVPGVASARSLSRAAIVVIAFGAASTAQLGATHQVVPTGCYDESAPIPGCTACNQTIPPPVPCPPNDCSPTVHQPSKTEAVPVSSGDGGTAPREACMNAASPTSGASKACASRTTRARGPFSA